MAHYRDCKILHYTSFKPEFCIEVINEAILPWYLCPCFLCQLTPSMPPAVALSASNSPTLHRNNTGYCVHIVFLINEKV